MSVTAQVARWMDPTTGTFLSVDPILDMRSPQHHNAYSYANNNPISKNDPTGMVTPFAMGIFTLQGLSAPMIQVTKTGTVTHTNASGITFSFSIPLYSYYTTNTSLAGTTSTTSLSIGGSSVTDAAADSNDGFVETHPANPGVQVAGKNDSDIAAMPGRALVKLNNDSINAQLDQTVADLRDQARAGEFEGLDVAAFKVRTIAPVRDLGVNRIVTGTVEVVARPPGTPGFPGDFAPSSFISPVGTFTTVSRPIFIHSARPRSVFPGVDLIPRGGP